MSLTLTNGSDCMILTEMESQVLNILKEELWSNWDCEQGYSNVTPSEISEVTKIPMNKLRGVLSSLVQKDLITIQPIDAHNIIVYSTLRTYFYFGEAEDWIIEEMRYFSMMTNAEISNLMSA